VVFLGAKMITDLTRNSVTIAGTIVERPSGVGPSDWMRRWETLIIEERKIRKIYGA
jgi:hypothetical protein